MKLIDLVGQKFGRLTVIERAEKNGKRTMWKCVCDCGELRVVWGDSLRRGSTKSCGCLDKLKDAIVARELAEGRYWNAIY